MASDKNYASETVENLISKNEAIIFSATYCKYCTEVKDLFKRLNVEHKVFEIDEQDNTDQIKEELYRRTKQKTVPSVFIHGVHMGGCDDTIKKHENGTLAQYLAGQFQTFDYDLIVIGGGPAGIAAAKEAALLKKNVAIFDFVKPSPKGTTWGVGGTCVNVGCIPKTLMHQAALVGDIIEDSSHFGWDLTPKDRKSHDWSIMVNNIQNHIKKTNFNHISYFRKNNIKYYNARVKFKNIHTIEATDKKGNVNQHTAYRFVLATGTRPHIPHFPGNNHAITTDDLFSLPTKPGKTLVIGGSYMALECAGFLQGLGVECTVMYRSQLLRGFDQQISDMIGSHLDILGINFIKGFIPLEITTENDPDPDKKLKVKMTSVIPELTMVNEGHFNMVLLATGRDAAVDGLNLNLIGVKLHPTSKKVIADKNDLTTCHTVYAIGDVQDGRTELASVAAKAGQQLVRRLFATGRLMDYKMVPIAVFTPLEYACCGYSEEEAKKVFGQDAETYYKRFEPIEWSLSSRNRSRCFCKVICASNLNNKVVGLHVLGPNAAEITQGFSLALKLNAIKSDFDQLVGIHPTCAEAFTSLEGTESGAVVAAETSGTC